MRIRAAFEAFFRAILREQPGRVTVVADCRKAHGRRRGGCRRARHRRTTVIRRPAGAVRREARRPRARRCRSPAASWRATGGASGLRQSTGQADSGLTGRSALHHLVSPCSGAAELKKPYVAIVDDDSGFANYLRTFLVAARLRNALLLARRRDGRRRSSRAIRPTSCCSTSMMPGHERPRDAAGAEGGASPTCR